MFCQVRGELTLHHSALLVGTDLATEFWKSENRYIGYRPCYQVTRMVEVVCPPIGHAGRCGHVNAFSISLTEANFLL